jgi:DNA topoisomerase-2
MDNMGRAGEMELKPFSGEDYTCITFQPDLSKFKMQSLDKDIVALMVRRAYDIAGSTKDVKVFLNGNKLPVSIFLSIEDTREFVIIVDCKIDFFFFPNIFPITFQVCF